MSLIKGVDDLKNKVFVLLVLDLIFFVLPGLAVIYLFNPDLFYSLDWIKLILLSASLTAPFILFNSILLGVIDNQNSNGENLFGDFSLGTILTGLLIYLIMASAYFMGRPMKEGIYVLCGIELVILFFAYWKEQRLKK